MRVSSWIALGLCLAAALSIASPAAADPQIVEQQTFYAITGATTRDLIAQMKSIGPSEGTDPHHWFARTDWHVTWRYLYRKQPNLCAIATVAAKATIVYVYPRWTNENLADPATRQTWRNFLANLQTHERGHGQHGIDAAGEVERTIAALPPQSSCNALGATANADSTAITRKYARMDEEYDRVTNHGATQGAILRAER